MKVSIIVPVYNVEEYLSECVSSILNQTYTNIELVLVDDGSTDKSGTICNEYAQNDSRVKVIHKKNGGVSIARNSGILAASGDYITFVDADDYILPSMIEKLLLLAIERNADICISNITVNKFQGDEIIINQYNNNSALGLLFAFEKPHPGCIPCGVCGGLYKRSVIINKRFPEDIHHYEDFYFLSLCISHSNVIVVINEPFYYYRVREGSANHSFPNKKHLSCLKIASRLSELIYFSPEDYVNLNTYFIAECYYIYIKAKYDDKYFMRAVLREICKNYRLILNSANLRLVDKLCLLSFPIIPKLNRFLVSKELHRRLLMKRV